MNLHTMSARQLRQELDAGNLSSTEVTEHFLGRIKQDQGEQQPLNAFIKVMEDDARQRAARADQRLKKGERSPLLGIPVALKDNLNLKGQPTSCGSRILQGYQAAFTAHAVGLLEEQGAVFLGKTNMDEFAMGSSTETSVIGSCHNPHDPARTCGGSSGGSAAAVAAGLAPLALGSDTGGSIRQPAAFCGVVGLKPTYGRVSRYGLVAYASSLDQIGPLAASVGDAAFLLQAIAGHDERDSTSAPLPVPDYTQEMSGELKGMRLGIPREYFTTGIDPDVENTIRHALTRLEKQGAEIREVSLPHTEYAVAVYYIVATAEASSNLARFDGIRYGYRAPASEDLLSVYTSSRAQGFGPEVQRRILLGTFVLSSGYYDAYYLKALRARTLIRRDFDAVFQEVDALVTPTAPTAAFPLGEKLDDPIAMYLSDIFTISANLAGIPGLVVPCGTTPQGLPVGVQFLGKAFQEGTLLRLGARLEADMEHNAG